MNQSMVLRHQGWLHGCFCLVLATSFIQMASGASCPLPDEHGLFSGRPCGLTDLSGREVVPAKYADIRYRGNGIFLITDIDQSDRYLQSNSEHLFNIEGQELEVRLPEGAQLVDVLMKELAKASESEEAVTAGKPKRSKQIAQ